MSFCNLLGAYNSLTDKHLTGYFNNTRIRRHLQKVGLLSRSGRIIPEKEYRHKLIQRAHQRHVRECLAQAIFHKVLDMERLHQIEIKRRLEDFARRERVHKIKVERSNRYEEDPIMMLSPRPPTGPKNSHSRHSGPEGENSESTESPGSSRPNTAPGKMQRPVRLKPLHSTSTPGSRKRNSSRYRHQESSNETDHPFSSPLERDAPRHLTLTDFSSTVSPYRLPVINNFVTPVPPLTKKREKGPKANGTLWGRRLRPTTAPSAADSQEGTVQRVSAQSTVFVKMIYFGKSVHLSHDLMDLRDEVKVFQQHCGGENLCVYKGRVKEGETFQFVSRRHRGFPFSLTFFLNGLQVERLSSCCEFKHRKGSRLGGRHGHFGFTGVEGASPCYRCIIAMGLDKKPTPPKRAKEDPLLSASRENSKEEEPTPPQETETDAKGEPKPKNDYEEDFEADDEGPVEDGADEGSETTPSPTREEEEKSGKKDQEENEGTEKNRDSDSEAGDSDKKVKKSPSISSGLSGSSSSSEDEDESDGGPEPGNEEDALEKNVEPERCDSTFTSEKDTKDTKTEETEAIESSSVSLPQQTGDESQTQESAVEKSEVEVSEDTERDNGEGETFGEGAAEKQAFRADGEEKEVEPEKAKSVQEKLAEAVLNVAECSSEPEFSDTTTEEDEVASVRTQQESPGAEAESHAAQKTSGQQEDISIETAVEPLEPAHKAGEVDGDADIEQHTEELEEETGEAPQPESKEQRSPEASEDTMEEQPVDAEQNDKMSIQDHPQQEVSAEAEGSESNVEVSEREKDSDVVSAEIDNKEQEEEQQEEAAAEEEDEASQEPQMVKTSDNEKTQAEAEGSKAEDLLVQEPLKEDETGDTSVEERELAQTGEDLEPQRCDPQETTEAVFETEGGGDADNSSNQDGEVGSQEQTEKDAVKPEYGDTGIQDKVDEGVRADERDDTEELRPDEAADGTEKAVEGNKEDGEAIGLDEGEDKTDETIEDFAQLEISEEAEQSETNLEVSERENKSEEERVEGEVEKAENNKQREAESSLEQDAEAEDERKSGDDGKDTDNDQPDESSKENWSLKEDETEGGEKTEQESEEKAEDVADDEPLRESVVEKDIEAEDESKADEGLKEPATEDGTDGRQPENETGSENQGEAVADEVENSTENNGHGEAEVNVKEEVEASQDNAGEEKTEGGNGGDETEVEEGLDGAEVEESVEDHGPQTEEVGGEDVAQEITMENMEDAKEGEEMVEDRANQENADEQITVSESNMEVSGTENKLGEPDMEAPEEDARERETESMEDKDAELEGESKSGKDMDNKPEEDMKDTGSIKENDIEDEGKPEDSVVVEDLDGKEEGGEKSTDVGRDESETQEGSEDDGMKQGGENSEQKEDLTINNGLQEATVSHEEKAGEEDTENGVEAIIAEGAPAKSREGEAAFEEGTEDNVLTEFEQGTANEEGLKDEQEDEASNNTEAEAEAEVRADALTTAEEPADTGTEMQGSNVDLQNGAEAKEASVAGDDNEDGKHDGAAEEEGSTSSASPSEDSQPAEKVTALKRDERESTVSEDTELLSTPPVDQGDLVSNWVNIHQTSRYFETFVEPLDDIKSLISQEGERRVNGEALEEVEGTVLSTKDSESVGGDKTSEPAKDEEVGIPLKSDLGDSEDTLVESFQTDMKPEAEPESEDKEHTEGKDTVPKSESLFASGEEQATQVTLDNAVNPPETPVMKFEISQDS
ncbi:glutamate-rich protein 3 [Salminus brasiliensis]|uniref:glutamate-rich protein 3 n=1 Tax=Salminus brasiliensis TaxID=930266 RepID=UPI003B83103E